jgi:Bifunctional DNA primase/polymerase, N-terminal/Primase C terminal 1 (PriCT-1)
MTKQEHAPLTGKALHAAIERAQQVWLERMKLEQRAMSGAEYDWCQLVPGARPARPLNCYSALALAEKGMAVFPCKPNDKIPITKNGCLNASTDAAVITAWWSKEPKANIGLATGDQSGVLVLDVDCKPDRDGPASLALLVQKYGPLPATTVVNTPSGGRHYYFKHPAGVELRSTHDKYGLGIDTRADGGYVLVPPSSIDGRFYEYSGTETLADLPVWLAAPPPRSASASGTTDDEWAELASGITDGGRNDALAKLCGRFIGFGMSARETLEHLRSWNERNKPPLDDKRLITCVKNIAVREIEKLKGNKNDRHN